MEEKLKNFSEYSNHSNVSVKLDDGFLLNFPMCNLQNFIHIENEIENNSNFLEKLVRNFDPLIYLLKITFLMFLELFY